MLQAYMIYFDIEIMKIQADGYDSYVYNDEITILVDNQGFNKSLSPLFEIISSFGDVSQLMGRLLFVRSAETDYSTDIGGISMQDIYEIRDSIDI